MKKLFLLSVVTLLSVAMFAQERKVVEFESAIHDFGVIAEGSGNAGRVTAIFKFKNTSNAPVFIESARASCGCTTPQVDATKPIAPGETGEIPVTYNTNGRPGSFNKQVTVTIKNAAGETSIERLYVRGEVTPKGAVTPQPMEEVKPAAPAPQANEKAKEATQKAKKAKKAKKTKRGNK